ncbi:hypothetical protein FHT86_000873 [Rhizobium sp. BK313]|nr:hypothetical protein [Rhizobium sp. BK313]
MSDDINKPSLDLRTTPVRPSPWKSWIAVLAVIIVAALAWNFWPHAGTINSSVPAAQTTTTPPPATATPPATAPAQ